MTGAVMAMRPPGASGTYRSTADLVLPAMIAFGCVLSALALKTPAGTSTRMGTSTAP